MACERDKFNHSFPDCPQSAAKKGLTKAENVEIYGEGDLLSVLLREEIAFLIHERRDKEVEDIFNKMGVIHPIRYDGHDICEQTNQEVLSKFNVKTSANILNCRSNLKDTKPALINTITDMVKECSYPVNGQGLANCPFALGWAELPRKLLLFLGRVRRSVF